MGFTSRVLPLCNYCYYGKMLGCKSGCRYYCRFLRKEVEAANAPRNIYECPYFKPCFIYGFFWAEKYVKVGTQCFP